jgi:hypothetical protein
MCYVDPFGIVEIYTHSYELTYSSGAYARYKNNTGKTKYIGD